MEFTLPNAPKVRLGLSERTDGSMVWLNTLPVESTVAARRSAYFTNLGIAPSQVVSAGLVHGSKVTVVDQEQGGQYLQNTDALITAEAGLVLTITAADCLPVYFYAQTSTDQAIGLAHAGWRGLVGGILESTADELRKKLGPEPVTITALIGPHIHAHHYEIGPEVANQLASKNIEMLDGRIHANLTTEAIDRLTLAGVQEIITDPTCTFCAAEHLYSARFDRRTPVEGAVAYMSMQKTPTQDGRRFGHSS
jgi:YfiH family protein